MKKLTAMITALALGLLLTALPVSPGVQAGPGDGPSEKACWGQATKVFARTGTMGQHASQQSNPRLGLRNLARALFEQGVIPDDSLQSLGRFVAAELRLSIDACQ